MFKFVVVVTIAIRFKHFYHKYMYLYFILGITEQFFIVIWKKIEQFWPFEEIFIFSNGGHLGFRKALTDTILKGDHLRIISAKFG